MIVGVWPFESALNAEFMANEVPGVTVPEPVVERMRQAPSAEAAAAEGVAIAREVGHWPRGSTCSRARARSSGRSRCWDDPEGPDASGTRCR
jgi:hypothetical protein